MGTQYVAPAVAAVVTFTAKVVTNAVKVTTYELKDNLRY